MDPEVWRWVWLVAAATFVVGEIVTGASFFILPFAVGAAVAAVLAFAGASDFWQWLAFVGVSLASFAAVRPLVKHLNQGTNPTGVGADRLIGETGVVVADLDPQAEKLGAVRIGREEWPAQAADGQLIVSGSSIEVLEIQGTRAIVRTINN
ncbi:MAG TPA: NfeD family protein [Acidimicrobiia bacterium]|jgi:membrane protein implicated in regulation of membrane protease activity|nr:NfeD family protein [Acidimicrobiia bacterium]HIL47276.1 NfeD family protein [Acidimicrobiia bacterium]